MTDSTIPSEPVDFDPNRGNRYVRFSFAASHEEDTGAAIALIDWSS